MSPYVPRAAACVPHIQSDPTAKRLSQNASMVLKALEEVDKPCKAYDILDLLRDRGVSSPMTVYRALDRLSELGYIRRIESLNAYMAVPTDALGMIAFRVCRKCQRAEVIVLEQSAIDVLAMSGIDVDNCYIETYCDCYAS